jgi:hypothetical protein
MSSLEVQDPRDGVAIAIAEMWTSLNNQRASILNRMEETRAYVTAPNTTYTEVGSKLPWKNKTVIPILTQIADNLQSYYMAALMPSDDWFRWEGRSQADQDKANNIEAYMSTKIIGGRFRDELEKLIRDWIIYGNAFAGVTWIDESTIDPASGESIQGYVGPKLNRISPFRCVLDINAPNFDKTPFIRRDLVPLSDILGNPDYPADKLEYVKQLRDGVTFRDFVDQHMENALRIDGYQEFTGYLKSQYIEVIEFWGDLYDKETETVLKNRRIVIVDRSFVLLNDVNPAWTGKKPFAHSGWRVLPDNLMGQGPLENLVGMQYRIDHLENLKADAYDQIIHPMIKIKGDTVDPDFEFGPGQRIYTGSEGDVEFLRPDASVLSANSEINNYRQFMELSAGAPRETAGFRSPGEKTAFEVSSLQQGADRMFLDKLNHFEEHMIQPILNLFFELMVRNMDVVDIARTFKDEENIVEEMTFTKEDVTATGSFRPQGSKYFAARNKRIQELQNLMLIAQNPTIAPHFSGVNAGKMIEEELGFEKWNVIEEFIGLREQIQGQLLAQQMQQEIQNAGGGQPEEEGI